MIGINNIDDHAMINTTVAAFVLGDAIEVMRAPAEDLAVPGVLLHPDLIEPLSRLSDLSKKAGFHLKVISGFRSFDRQLAIWNAKALGLRPVLDRQERLVDLSRLSDTEKVFTLLNWSALPGASRHHWGTDIDVYDARATPEGYSVQLTAAEATGLFGSFHEWLTQTLASNSLGFYRPYINNRGAVAEELWHLSCGPLANPLANQLTESLLRQKIESTEIELKPAILEALPRIFAEYIEPYRPSNNSNK